MPAEQEVKTYTVARNRAYWVRESQQIQATSREAAEDLFPDNFNDVDLGVGDVFVDSNGEHHYDEPKARRLTLKEGMVRILEIIEHLDALPEDHEPDLEILWDTIRSIEDIAKEDE